MQKYANYKQFWVLTWLYRTCVKSLEQAYVRDTYLQGASLWAGAFQLLPTKLEHLGLGGSWAAFIPALSGLNWWAHSSAWLLSVCVHLSGIPEPEEGFFLHEYPK